MQTISDDYKRVLADTHIKVGNWGTTAGPRYKMIVRHLQEANTTVLLDYGSGTSSLKNALDKYYPNVYNVIEYEPGMQDKCSMPEPCEFVVCIDVLEHVEPEFIENVLDDLQRVTLKHALITISTEPAHTILSDGRNAHLIVEPYSWWLPKISERFNILNQAYNTRSCLFLLGTK